MNILDIYGTHTIRLIHNTPTPYGPKPGRTQEITGCFVVEKPHQIRDHTGTQVQASAQIAVPHGTSVNLEDEPTVILPSGRTVRLLAITHTPTSGLSFPECDIWSVQ